MRFQIRRDRSFLRVSGRDRVKWLQGLVTAELTTLSPGGGCFATACNRQGKMVGAFIVRVFEDHLLLEMEPAVRDPLVAHLDRHLIMEDAALARVEFLAYEVHGEGLGIPWFHFVPAHGGIASANRMLGDGMTLLVSTPVQLAPEISSADYERLRVEAGWPAWGTDMGPDELPMEAGLEPIAISYAKGCYLGQEVVLRVKNFGEPPKRLVQLDRAAPPGSPIRSGDGEIGKITSSAGSASLGYVRKEHRTPGTPVVLSTGSACVRDLPWHARAERPPDRPKSEVGKIAPV